jgi:acyl-CoA synthetase (NDP forming)
MNSGLNTDSLDCFLRPAGIAVFGASENNPRSFGSLALTNIVAGGFTGDLVVVHPSATSVLGVRAVPTLAEAEFIPDLCVVAVRSDAVLPIVDQCAVAGVRAISVVGSGYAESGTQEGIELQAAIVSAVRGAGMRVLGPNAIGAADFSAQVISAATANIPPGIKGGDVCIVSQSGGLGTTILATAQRYGVALGPFVSLGNEADVSAADAIAYAVERGASAILCYLETLRDPSAFAEAARLARERNVPIIVLKGGTEPAGQAVTASHTAALAGSMRVMDSVFADLGVSRVTSIEALICAGALFGAFGNPPGDKCGVLGIGGGNCALLADATESAGLKLATLSTDTSIRLKEMLPDSNGSNPFDPGGWFLGKHHHLLEEALRDVAEDPAIDVMIYGMVPLSPMREEVYVGAIAAVAQASSTPAISLSMHTPSTEYRTSAYSDAGILELGCTSAATEALGVWMRYAPTADTQAQTRLHEIVDAPELARIALDHELASELAQSGRVVLLEDRAVELLSKFGLRFPPTAVADSVGEGLTAAEHVGYPLVVKALADGLHHRAQIGAVALGVTSTDLNLALTRVDANARAVVPSGTHVRLLLQQQVASGIEMIVGIQRDTVFGPVVVVGLGGVWSELLDDVAFGVPPISAHHARDMLSRLRGAMYLERAASAGDFDKGALVELLQKVGSIAESLGAVLESLDLNPVIVTGGSATVVDALAVLTASAP